MSEIRGMWPGGPARSGVTGGKDRPPGRLGTVEDRASRIAVGRLRRAARRRARRLALAFGALLVVSGVGGWLVGRSAHRTQLQLTEERMGRQRQPRPTQEMEDLVRDEATRLIQNLWLTEIMEAQRSR